MLLIGLMAALGCGFGLGFLKEYLDRAFWSRKEIEGVLGIPVLGSVPFVYTVNDRRWGKVRLVGAVCALCVMGYALFFVLAILSKESPGVIPL
jgi:hypothetical protein